MKGRVLEVDFNKYPKELYQLHNDFPLALDGIEIIVIKRGGGIRLSVKGCIIFPLVLLKNW